MNKLGDLGWVAHRSYEIEGRLFGVRTNSEAFAAWLDDVLAGHAVTDAEAEPNFSCFLADRPGGFHLLYRDSNVVARSFDLRVVARALLAAADTLAHETRSDALYLRATTIEREGVRMLLHNYWVASLLEHRREVAREGILLPWAPSVALDLDTGALVPPPPVLQAAPGAIEELIRISKPAKAPEQWAEHTHAVTPDVFLRLGFAEGEATSPLSPALAAYNLLLGAHNLPLVKRRGVDAVVGLVTSIPCYDIGFGIGGKLVPTLGAILREVGAREPTAEHA